MYLQRTLEHFFQRACKQFPVLLMTGPRQVGKTTFLRHMSEKKRTYLTLDDPMIAQLAQQDPRLFLERFKPPLLIDEIQYAPNLLPFIKMHVDNHPVPGQFWLTGSQQFQLMQGVSESLAGRVGVINLLGLSLFEQLHLAKWDQPFVPLLTELQKRETQVPQLTLNQLYTYIWRGSFPGIALNADMEHDLFYSSYVNTYLQRDIRSLSKIGDHMAFLKFLRATAARTGQLLNLADLARDCNISPPTAKSWLSILETSGIIYLLEPYFTNLTKRLVKTPKLYFLDTGLCCYLTEWSSPKVLEAGAMAGPILETFVVSMIIKSFWHNGKRAPLYYYRDKDKREIDLLILQDRTLYPLEIKKTGAPTQDAIRHFSALMQLPSITVGPGGLICFIDRVFPMTTTMNAIPIALV